MSTPLEAQARAQRQVDAARDSPARRVALLAQTYRGPTGRAPQHVPFRRAALSFMHWQANRGVLDPPGGPTPGSPWWRAINESLLRDGCEGLALYSGLDGPPSSLAVALWLGFIEQPHPKSWYRAHNASIVAAYFDNLALAAEESAAERFFMNVALTRVLFAHALVAAPRLALGRFASVGKLLGDPRLGAAGAFLSLSRVLPRQYPLEEAVEFYIRSENRLASTLDYAIIAPRLQALYAWSADELLEPRLLDLIRDGNPIYAWPFDHSRAWRANRLSGLGRLAGWATRPT